MLLALLGELHYTPLDPDSFFSLPRDGGIAYAAQESWVQNETIRDNIIFDSPVDEVRYKKVIDQCCLAPDLALFETGDRTEVGEKGLTLSGGQKARLTLARALYSSASILLLDDVLAAVDVHTARWIVEKCFQGDLISGRTVILVTHNIAMTSAIADFVVSLGTDGQVVSQGSMDKAIIRDKALLADIRAEAQELELADQKVTDPRLEDKSKTDGKLMKKEEVSEGHVGWQALKLYFSAVGGNWNFLFWFWFLGNMFLCELVRTLQPWWLGVWAAQYENAPPSGVSAPYYLSVYAWLLVLWAALFCVAWIAWAYGLLRASRIIHNKLVNSIFGTTLRWLDQTPASRIITRCTQDIQAVDGKIPSYFGALVSLVSIMVTKLGGIVMLTPIFLLPSLLVAAIGGWFGNVYTKGQLSVKREMSNARAPVLANFGAAISGLTSIRAYGAQDYFRRRSYERIDRYSRSARIFHSFNRWISVRMESIGALLTSSLAAYLVYVNGLRASDIGFSLTMAVSFSGMIHRGIRFLNEFQVEANSLERIEQYMNIEQEPKPTKDGVPAAYWPATGELRVENLSARYSVDGPKILNGISFYVRSGERIGIVGRTGSGKSSLLLSLLRLIPTEGKVYYDGLLTSNINLSVLRSNVTIIPQMPELLSGTLRQNLDPFSQYDDALLNDALRSAGLFSIQDAEDENRLTLDSAISSGGGNLSVGQRQILALARAIIRRSKLLILDEATSAIDYETDAVIQTSLRNELPRDVTVLTVAHRLQTIMDADRIMVLDAGKIVEFGKPRDLLKNVDGLLRALVDESGEKEALYAMAA